MSFQDGLMGTGNLPSSGNQNPKPGNEPQGQGTEHSVTAPPFQIDPRFANLPPAEAIARTVQSMMTPLHQKIKELSEKNQKFDTYVETLGLVIEDKDARLAFINELEPGLVGNTDVDSQVKAELDKKYGAEFKPNREEANEDHWSTSAKYFRDMDKLYKKFEEGGQKAVTKTFKEIKNEVLSRKNQLKEMSAAKVKEFRERTKISDGEFEVLQKYAQNLTIDDVYNSFINANRGEQTPSISGFTGIGKLPLDQKLNKVNELFGPNRS